MKARDYIYGLFFISMIIFSYCRTKKEAAQIENAPPAGVVEGLNLGNLAPEIEMKNTKDSVIKLSSLRGKVVLVDFWAAWCRPCRAENPNVVNAYKKYNALKLKDAKGFEILSVSLDQNKPNWMNAIVADHLYWPYHVSDLMGWNNAAALKYGVQGIPTNYLLDAKGVIIGKALRGEDLDKALENLVVK